MSKPESKSKIEQKLYAQFKTLKTASLDDPYPNLNIRRDRIQRAIDILTRSEKRIVDAINTDFGGQPEAVSLIIDVMAPIRSLQYAHKHVARWMKLDKRKPEFPLGLMGAKAGIFYQPLGVVGNMSPWNAPVGLAFSPLASMLSAGNRVFMRPSEYVPTTSNLIAEMIESAFDPSEIAIATGGVELAQAFSSLPFDHLLFTGGASTARHVMRAAAENLVPLTLELGGKAPCIVAKDCDLADAASKFARGKTLNGGQVCMAPDFGYVHSSNKDQFADELKTAVKRMHPQYGNGPDYTHIHLEHRRHHLKELVCNAIERGAQVEVLDGSPIAQLGQDSGFPPVLVIDPPMDSLVMTEEVFGPIMPVITYDKLEEVVQTLKALPRPLALYFIGGSQLEKDFLLQNTWSGGVSFDDVQFHIMMQDYGQGGVGESGMGRYLGFEGFKTMSNCRSIAQRPWVDISKFITPPYKPSLVKHIRGLLKS